MSPGWKKKKNEKKNLKEDLGKVGVQESPSVGSRKWDAKPTIGDESIIWRDSYDL